MNMKQIIRKSPQATGLKPKKTSFYLRIRSRHPSIDDLRKFIKLPVRAVYRHGSTTKEEGVTHEINSVESVHNSASKFRMKACFAKAGVKTAEYFFVSEAKALSKIIGVDDNNEVIKQLVSFADLPFPLVAKLNMGSRGTGMVKIDNQEHLEQFITNRVRNNNYYFEKFYNYSREYRLHVDAQGCFYTCRKVLKNETPEDARWYRNDSNCTWILEENPTFNKPKSWDKIVEHCVLALKSVGLDIGACDVKVQTDKTPKGGERPEQDFIVIEINSAPSFGTVTLEKYKERLPETLKNKYVIR